MSKKKDGPAKDRRPSAEIDELVYKTILVGKEAWSPHDKTMWAKYKVMKHEGFTVKLKNVETNETKEVDLHYDPVYPVNPEPADDMTSLHSMTEPGIMYNLEERQHELWKQLEADPTIAQCVNGGPYTYVANVLIAVNPLRFSKTTPEQVKAHMDSYEGTKPVDMPPHPYGLAEMAYSQMVSSKALGTITNQSLVISGESGAGKTETCKIMLRYVVNRGPLDGGKTSDAGLDRRLMESNPILEGFGNAKTHRNPNSSRFGKFMKLQFSEDGNYQLVGATLETYLLERSRLVFQMDGERNYHIFYMICAGATNKQRTELRLKTAEHYNFINQSGCYQVDGFDDIAEYKDVQNAFSCVKIDDKTIAAINGVLAGVLHLGNVEIEETTTSEGDVAAVKKSEQDMKDCAHCFGVDAEGMRLVLCERVMQTRSETFQVKRSKEEATFGRDAVAKTVFNNLFLWIVKKVAESLDERGPAAPFVGILDIFGFETFKKNDFEQLLINFANEALQRTFNKCVLVAEMELYRSEGISIPPVKIDDNSACVELVGGKPSGILKTLENVGKAPKPSDQKFLETIHRTHAKHPFFPKPHPKVKREAFIIKHFADVVTYTVGTFIQKNNDTVPGDLLQLMKSTTNFCVQGLFPGEVDTDSKKKTSQTVTNVFNVQMHELRSTLESTATCFVRCLKPNFQMEFGCFDRNYVVGQLRSLGVMATCKVLKAGLPTRVQYTALETSLRNILPVDLKPKFARFGPRKLCEALLWSFEVPWDDYRCGRTRIFFRSGKIGKMQEIQRMNMASGEGKKLIAKLKKWLIMQKWKWATAMISHLRTSVWLLELIRSKPGMALRIQCAWRRKKAYLTVAAKLYWRRFYRVVAIKMIACKHFVFRYRAIHAERIQAREVAAKKEEEDRKKRVVLKEKMDSLQKIAESTELELPSSGSSKIIPLLASVQKHKKFKRLICKSIDSVTEALNPDKSGYETNLSDAVRCNGPQFILAVLAVYKGEDGEVFRSCAKCLKRMSQAPELAELIAQSDMLLLMRTEVEMHEAEDEWLRFISNLCHSCPGEIVSLNGVELIMETAKKSDKHFKLCISPLEALAGVPDGASEIEQGGGIELILKSVKPTAGVAVLDSAFKFLNQFASSFAENQLGRITNLIMKTLENHSDSEKLVRGGGMLLGAVTRGNIDAAHMMLKRTNLSEGEIWSLLSLNSLNADKIVKNHLPTIVGAINEKASPTEVETNSKCLSNLATSIMNIKAILKAGAVDALCAAIKSSKIKGATAAVFVVSALGKLAALKGAVDKIVEHGAVIEVCGIIHARPDFVKFTEAALVLIRQLSSYIDSGSLDKTQQDNLVQTLKDAKAIAATTAGMKSTSSVMQQGGQRAALPRAQAAAIASLDCMCVTREDVGLVVDNGGLDVLVMNLNSHERTQTLRQCLSVLAKIASLGHAKALVSAKVLAGVRHINNHHREDKHLRAGVSQLLDALTDAIDIDKECSQAETLAGGQAVKFKQLQTSLMNISILTYSPQYAAQIASKIIPIVLTALENAYDKDTKDSGGVIDNALLVLIGLSKQCDILSVAPDTDALIRTVTKGPCEKSKFEHGVLLSLELLSTIANKSDTIDMIFDGGVINACKAGLTIYQQDADIAARAAGALLQIAKHAGAIHVVQQGGSRALIESIKGNSNRAGWATAVHLMMTVLARIAADDTCRSVIRDEGAAVAAQTALGTSASGNDKLKKVGCALLALVTTEDDIQASVAAAATALRSENPGAQLLEHLRFLQPCSLLLPFKNKMRECKAVDLLSSVVAEAEFWACTNETQLVVGKTFKTIVKVADGADLPDLSSLIGEVFKRKRGEPHVQFLQAVADVADVSEAWPSLVLANVTENLESCLEGPPKPTDQCAAECVNALMHLWKDDHVNMSELVRGQHDIFAKKGDGKKGTINIGDGLKWLGNWLSHTPLSYDEPMRDTAVCNLLVNAVGRSAENLHTITMEPMVSAPLLDGLPFLLTPHDGEQYEHKMIFAALHLLLKMSNSNAAVNNLLHKNIVNSIVTLFQAEPAIPDDVHIALEAARLTELLIVGQGDDQEEANALAVRDQGGLELITISLRIHSYHTELLNIASRLLPKMNIASATDQVAAAVGKATSANKDKDVRALGDAMQTLANQLVSEDVSADLIAVQKLAFDTIGLLASMPPSTLQLRALTASLQTLGRLTRVVDNPVVLKPAVTKLSQLVAPGNALSVDAKDAVLACLGAVSSGSIALLHAAAEAGVTSNSEAINPEMVRAIVIHADKMSDADLVLAASVLTVIDVHEDEELVEVCVGAITEEDSETVAKKAWIRLKESLGLGDAASVKTGAGRQKLEDAFKKFDTDGSGSIDVDELDSVLRSLHVYKSKKELKAMLKEADEDGGGEIEIEEFITLMDTNIAAAIAGASDAKPTLGIHKGLQLILASTNNLGLQGLLTDELMKAHSIAMVSKALTQKQGEALIHFIGVALSNVALGAEIDLASSLPTLLEAVLSSSVASEVMKSDVAAAGAVSILNNPSLRVKAAHALVHVLSGSHAPVAVKQALGDAQAGAAVMTGLELQPAKAANMEFVKDALVILQELGEVCGMREIGIAENAPEVIEAAVGGISAKGKLQQEQLREIKDLKLIVLDEIALAFGNHPSFKLKEKFEILEDNVIAVETTVVVIEEKGEKKTQYDCDGDLTDEMPEDYQALMTFIDEMLELVTELVPDRVLKTKRKKRQIICQISEENFLTSMSMMQNFNADSQLVFKMMKIWSKLCVSAENAKTLLELGADGAVADLMGAHAEGEVELLLCGVQVVCALAQHGSVDAFLKEEGIKFLLGLVQQQIEKLPAALRSRSGSVDHSGGRPVAGGPGYGHGAAPTMGGMGAGGGASPGRKASVTGPPPPRMGPPGGAPPMGRPPTAGPPPGIRPPGAPPPRGAPGGPPPAPAMGGMGGGGGGRQRKSSLTQAMQAGATSVTTMKRKNSTASMMDAVREAPLKMLVERCLGVIANLPKGDPEKYDEYYQTLMENKFLDIVEQVIGLYMERDAPQVIMRALETLSALGTLNASCKMQIFEKCGTKMLRILDRRKKNAEMCMQVLNTFTSLFEDNQVKTRVTGGRAITVVVGVMTANMGDLECLQKAISVLEGFTTESLRALVKSQVDMARAGQPQPMELSQLDSQKPSPSQRGLVQKSVITAVVEVMESNKDNNDLFLQCMVLLSSIVWDKSSSPPSVMSLLFRVVGSAFKLFGFITGLNIPTLSLLYMLLTKTRKGIEYYSEAGGVEQLLTQMTSCESSLLAFFGTCIEKIVKSSSDSGRRTFTELKGVEATLKIMATQGKDNQEFLMTSINTLTILSVNDDEAALEIGKNGMHVLAEIMKRHGNDVAVLSCVLQLQSQLAFEKQNILAIVQYGGIDGILDCIRENKEEKQLVIMCLQLLDNIFLGSQEYAAVAWEQGCSNDLDSLQGHYSDDADVLPAIRSARLNLDVSSMHKKQEKDFAMQKQRRADNKKKRAEVGKGQQARKLKMMSIRNDVPGVDVDSAPTVIRAGGLSGLRDAAGSSSKPKLQAMTSDHVLNAGANPLASFKKEDAAEAVPEPAIKSKKKGGGKLAGLLNEQTSAEPPIPKKEGSKKRFGGFFGKSKSKK